MQEKFFWYGLNVNRITSLLPFENVAWWAFLGCAYMNSPVEGSEQFVTVFSWVYFPSHILLFILPVVPITLKQLKVGASLCFFRKWTQTLETQTNTFTESPEHTN